MSFAFLLLTLGPTTSYAGYDLTISHSRTNPDVNTSTTPVGLDSLFLWVKCAEQGLSAVEADLSGGIPVLSFLPRPGVVNIGTATSLVLGISDCPSGDSTNAILGSIIVWDSTSTGGHLNLVESSTFSEPIVVSCDTTSQAIPFVPRIVGFSSSGSHPDTTGADDGCGMFPEVPAKESSGSMPYDWATRFGPPSGGGQGANNTLFVLRKLKSPSNAILAAGKFTQVASLTVPNVARLTVGRSGGPVTTTWDLPSQLSSLPALPSGKSYYALDQGTDGAIALVGTANSGSTLPFMYAPSSGSWVGDSPGIGYPLVELFTVEHWGANGRYLVGGYFDDFDQIDPDRFKGLAQYNPESTGSSKWERFGYPIVGEDAHYYFERDLQSNDEVAYAMLEVNLPGNPHDGSLFLGGSFKWVFGVDWSTSADLTFAANNCAFLNATTGEFTEAQYIKGPVYTLAQSTAISALDGGKYVYAAGQFGNDPANPGSEYPSVMRADLTEHPLYVAFSRVGIGPGPPWAGPMKSGTASSPVIRRLVATREHLYAIGDFDRVLPIGGEPMDQAKGFARYSFATGLWESLGQQAIGDYAYAGEADWPAVFVGGSFTTVASSIASSYIGEADFDLGVVGVSDGRVDLQQIVGISLVVPRPNPSKGNVDLGYTVPSRREVNLTIYDVTGRAVAVLESGVKNPGEYVSRWTGSDTLGRPVSTGVYLARLKSGSSEVTQKVIVMR